MGGIVCSAKRTRAVVQDKDYLYMLLKCALLITVKFIEAFKKLYYNKKKAEPRCVCEVTKLVAIWEIKGEVMYNIGDLTLVND